MVDTDEYVSRLVDEERLAAYLAAELGTAETFDIEYHAGGHSNEMLFLTLGDRDLVLRRPPPGDTPASAHNVLREHRILSALSETAVPVPETVLACDDHDIIGSDFFVMERVEGTVIHNEDGEPDRFAEPDHRRRVGEELATTLADVHGVDYETVGLVEFGSPEAYLEKQVSLWTGQLERNLGRSGRDLPALREVGQWLDASIPDQGDATLVHGDYKLDNVMFGAGTPPEIVGVFDWEMSTLGDPLADVGYMLFNWAPGGADRSVPELFPQFTDAEGYPSQRELVDAYEAASGRMYRHDRFYRTLGGFKLTTALEAFYSRYLAGTASDPMYPLLEDGVPDLAARLQRIVDGDEPLA